MSFPGGARWRWWEMAGLALLLALLVYYFNHRFESYTRTLPQRIAESNYLFRTTDEYYLLLGYHRTPDLWRDGLAWWYGTWIHALTHFYRPFSSYLHWAHCFIGLNYGWRWVGWMGLALFWCAGLTAVALTWRVTRSKPATFLAVALFPVHRFFNNNGQPAEWAAWWPGHPDLLVGTLIIGALVCFDLWLERGQSSFLAGMWILFLLACGVKEHAYIFPAMAMTLVFLRPGIIPRHRRVGQALLLMAAVVALYLYRGAVVPDAFRPPLQPGEIIKQSLSFMYPALYKPLKLGDYNQWLFATLVYTGALGWLWARCLPQVQQWLKRPFVGVAVGFGLVGAAALAAVATGTIYLFADPGVAQTVLLGVVGQTWATYYTIRLLFRYRKTHPCALVWLLLWLAYLPVYFSHNWYYTTVGWLFRMPYWALLAQLVWRDIGEERTWNHLRTREWFPLPWRGSGIPE